MPRRRRSPSPTSTDSDTDESRHHPQRNAANARERARMRVLSQAFCRLKTTLPWVPADTKLSKLDTLRLATSYIAHLRAALTDQPLPESPSHKHPLTLTWPFSFQRSEAAPLDDGGGGEAHQGAQHQHHPPWEDAQPPHIGRDHEVSYYY